LLRLELECRDGEGGAVNTRRNLTLLGIVLTVIPSCLCVWVGEAANLSGGDTFWKAILFIVLIMTLIGGIIGFATSVILPNRWVVVVGSQLGWIGGLVLGALIATALPISPYDPLSPLYFVTIVIGCGLVAGLLPLLIASFIQGGR